MPEFLDRHRNILDFALSSLMRRRWKYLSLLAVYTAVVALLASVLFMVQSLKREAELLLRQAPDMVVQRMSAGRHDLVPTEWVKQIVDLAGVGAVTPRWWGYHYDPVFNATYTLQVPDNRRIEPGSAVVGSGVARNQRIKTGDLMTFRGYDRTPLLLQVEEIFPAVSELVAADLVLMSPADFHSMFRMPEGQATDLAVTVANPAELATIAAKIAELLPGARPILKNEMQRTYQAIFDWRGGVTLLMLAGAVLAFVIFAWDRAAGLSAEERREIGILKSIGWETSDVMLLKFWEGTAVSLTAFLAGVALAYAHVFFFSAALFAPVLKGWSVLYPHFRLVPALDGYQLAVLFFLTVVPYAAATVVPAWMSATIDPDAALRS